MIIVVNTIPYLAEALKQHHDVMSVPHSLITNQLLRETGCEALFIRTTTKVSSDLIEGTALRFIGSATSGTDHIDRAALDARSIVCHNAAGSNANAVAEYVLYTLCARALEQKRSIRELVLGVVGFGHIGKLVAAYALHLGMTVLVNDPPLEDSGVVLPESVAPYTELDELISRSDVLSNHIPYSTSGPYPSALLFHRDRVRRFKSDMHFIHTSRGGIVDEEALLERCSEEQFQCSLDVWDKEPEYSLELARRSNLASPHISGHSEDGIIDAAERLLRAYEMFSTQHFDASIAQYVGSNRVQVESMKTMEELVHQLSERLHLAHSDQALRHPPAVDSASRREHFLALRFSYGGRRELFLRPTLA